MRRKGIKIIASALVFCILFTLTGKLLRYILVDDYDSYTRVTYHEMYEQDNIDVLFVGSSHCYRSFIPELLDEELHQNTFNAGSSAQAMDGSLMLIREAVKYNDIKHIYLEIYFGCAFGTRKDRTQMTGTYIISDYLRPSIDRTIYLLKASDTKYYANSFIIARRNWSRLFDFEYITNILIKKSTERYKSYDYECATSDVERYAGKGYVANTEVVSGWNYFSTDGWESIDIENVSDDWRKDLKEIIEFCERKDIPLTLIGAPMSNFYLTGVGNYDEYIDCINKIIAEKDIEYYDFNLCRERYFPNASELFKDADHMNCYGAEIFSHSFALLVSGKIHPDEMFYDSYEKKLNNIPRNVFGVNYKDETLADGTVLRNCRIVSNGIGDFEYAITIEPSEGEAYILRDYSSELAFSLKADEKGICIIDYRSIDGSGSGYKVRLNIP